MKKNETTSGRRGFLKGVAVAGSGAAVAITAAKMISPEQVDAASGKEDSPSKGYHLSDHISAYYKTTSF
jgi:nitrous oxide reductase|tara:strand:+ start:3931 stop:4137 length:207 start_codon:yes stop_codon:yes gene_type:complete